VLAVLVCQWSIGDNPSFEHKSDIPLAPLADSQMGRMPIHLGERFIRKDNHPNFLFYPVCARLILQINHRKGGRPMKIRQLLIPFVLGLGLLLGLLWVLGGVSPEVRAAPGDVYCVDPGGGSYPACTEVFTNVQAAVDAASGGEEIRVAGGIYRGVRQRKGITQAVYISKTVVVRGGYTTTDGFAGPPDPVANPTTLDAQGLGRVMTISDTSSSFEEIIAPTIEGLRITGGDVTGLEGPAGSAGGGVYVYSARVTISNCTVTSNTGSQHGGGLYFDHSNVTLWGNTIQGNNGSTHGGGDGGGLHLRYSDATLIGNKIVSNTAGTDYFSQGGGVYAYSSTVSISNCVVAENIASTEDVGEGGGLYFNESAATLSDNTIVSNTASIVEDGYGGGLYFYYSDVTLSGNTIAGNIASTGGEGMGGGVYLYRSDGATLSNNMIAGNIASTVYDGEGGGLLLNSENIRLEGNTVQGNIAGAHFSSGGGVSVVIRDATLIGNTIVSNTAGTDDYHNRGGGVYLYGGGNSFTLTNNVIAGNYAKTEGSGLWICGSPVEGPTSAHLVHNTIADNNGGSGQGVFVNDNTILDFTNTIIAGHSVGITATTDSTITLEATLWYSNGINISSGGIVKIGTVNIVDAPAFVDPSTWDYHLTCTSAAIDRGIDTDVDEDIDGESRPWGEGYDIGADESHMRCVYLPLILRNSP
jgi:hypothetical protein